AKTADGERHAIVEHFPQGSGGVGFQFGHSISSSSSVQSHSGYPLCGHWV
ncbi:UNVERIFIED_ORG: hypothetical protein ABIB52_003765, partial [Arthrobacter sp. UYCu721]